MFFSARVYGGSCFSLRGGGTFRLRTPLLRGEETSLTRRRARAGEVGVSAASECPLPFLVVGGCGGGFFYSVYAIVVQN